MPKVTKTTTRKPATKRTTRKKKVEITQEHIATRAYYIHIEEGGDPQTNWLRAERELVPA
jgi:Protein of unknown function (DUF2934)